SGLAVGVVLELFHLAVLPVGAARYSEGGPAAVVAGSLCSAAAEVPGALLMAVAFALAWEWVGGETLRVMRQINVRIVAGPEGEGRSDHLQLRHTAAILLDFFRGMLVVGTGLLTLATLLMVSANYWGLHPEVAWLAVTTASAGL